ncbi:MAG: DUF1854 domain-containing protein [Clostridiales bacterium]|nr:DUF1854 domain-containing protein [Clostridiales bacterium]
MGNNFENNASTIEDLVDIKYLDKEEMIFERTEGGFISMRLGDDFYPRISVYRSFPLSMPTKYISLREVGEKELGKEIGIIEDLNSLTQDKIEILTKEMDRMYFTPIVESIYTLKDDYGYINMDIRSSAGLKKLTVPNRSNNFVRLTDTRVLVIDIDGNRFEIPDYTKLDSKSIRLLETVI